MIFDEKDNCSKYYKDSTRPSVVVCDTCGKEIGTDSGNQRRVMDLPEDTTGYVPDKIGYVTRPHNEMMQRSNKKKKNRKRSKASKKSRKRNR